MKSGGKETLGDCLRNMKLPKAKISMVRKQVATFPFSGSYTKMPITELQHFFLNGAHSLFSGYLWLIALWAEYMIEWEMMSGEKNGEKRGEVEKRGGDGELSEKSKIRRIWISGLWFWIFKCTKLLLFLASICIQEKYINSLNSEITIAQGASFRYFRSIYLKGDWHGWQIPHETWTGWICLISARFIGLKHLLKYYPYHCDCSNSLYMGQG